MPWDWKSDSFCTYSNNKGQQFVSATLPTGIVDAASVKRYQATGPYMPVSFPAPTQVDDAETWIAEKQSEGFEFTEM